MGNFGPDPGSTIRLVQDETGFCALGHRSVIVCILIRTGRRMRQDFKRQDAERGDGTTCRADRDVRRDVRAARMGPLRRTVAADRAIPTALQPSWHGPWRRRARDLRSTGSARASRRSEAFRRDTRRWRRKTAGTDAACIDRASSRAHDGPCPWRNLHHRAGGHLPVAKLNMLPRRTVAPKFLAIVCSRICGPSLANKVPKHRPRMTRKTRG